MFWELRAEVHTAEGRGAARVEHYLSSILFVPWYARCCITSADIPSGSEQTEEVSRLSLVEGFVSGLVTLSTTEFV